MKISFQAGSIVDTACDGIVVSLFEGQTQPEGAAAIVDEALDGLIKSYLIDEEEFKGKLGSVAYVPTFGKIKAKKIVVVGLGKQDKFDINAVRKVAAEAAKACHKLKLEKVCTILHGAGSTSLPMFDTARALAEGTILSVYSFDKYKSKKAQGEENPSEKKLQEVTVIGLEDENANSIRHGLFQGQAIAEGTCLTRDLVSEPASDLPPWKLAECAQQIGLECKVYEKEEIENMKMGSFLGVARGSDQPPKLIHLIYRPDGEPRKKIAVVGKGITFDSGGLDLKPAPSMVDMKIDMGGAGAVLGVMKAIKELRPQVEVHGIIPTCENMPSGKAYKPGDVLVSRSGKTIEIGNTDAEGRLILADALDYAVEQGVDEIIDIATLTGAVVIALGSVASGVMTNKQEFLEDFLKKAENSGEKNWQLPLFEEYRKQLKSDIADIKNVGGREAGSCTAGMFLKEFVKDVPWIHIDIAGTVASGKPAYEIVKGATGASVRSIVYYMLNS